MDLEEIPRKTDKGRFEVQTRAFHVGPRERSVLIMVDGKTPARVLLARLAFMKKADVILDELCSGGFIDTEVEVEELDVGIIAPTLRLETPLTEALRARRFARDFVLETLGPAGDDLAIQLECCLSREQLLPILEKCRDHVGAVASLQKAEEFWEGLGMISLSSSFSPRLAA
jgi:hypothetical protein